MTLSKSAGSRSRFCSARSRGGDLVPFLIPRPKSVTLDGSGNGTVSFSIDNSNTRWLIDEIAVQTNQAQTATPVPSCIFRTGDPVNGIFQGGTASGNLDTATGRILLYEGDILYATFQGGIPGSVGTVTIGGTFTPAGAELDG
jgi:hypothetical protein